MSNQRSLDEWFQLVTECRCSGLTDTAWCEQHGISHSTFNHAVRRLRKHACQIPEHSGIQTGLDLTASKEPVEIHVTEEPAAYRCVSPAGKPTSPHLDNSHMIEITIGDATLKVCNGADPDLLQNAILAIGRMSYAG